MSVSCTVDVTIKYYPGNAKYAAVFLNNYIQQVCCI